MNSRNINKPTSTSAHELFSFHQKTNFTEHESNFVSGKNKIMKKTKMPRKMAEQREQLIGFREWVKMSFEISFSAQGFPEEYMTFLFPIFDIHFKSLCQTRCEIELEGVDTNSVFNAFSSDSGIPKDFIRDNHDCGIQDDEKILLNYLMDRAIAILAENNAPYPERKSCMDHCLGRFDGIAQDEFQKLYSGGVVTPSGQNFWQYKTLVDTHCKNMMEIANFRFQDAFEFIAEYPEV